MLAVTEAGASFADTRYWPALGGHIGGALRAEQNHFLAATLAGSPYLVPVEGALAAVLVNAAIRRALADGGSVEVER
jgi:hypothetical protein